MHRYRFWFGKESKKSFQWNLKKNKKSVLWGGENEQKCWYLVNFDSILIEIIVTVIKRVHKFIKRNTVYCAYTNVANLQL